MGYLGEPNFVGALTVKAAAGDQQRLEGVYSRELA